MNIMLEDKQLANEVLERYYYSCFREGGPKHLQIFLTGACRSNCEYCYLRKNMKDLYPLELQNYETILKNVELICNWYIDSAFKCNLQVFSAEWLTTPLADRVFDIFYKVFKDSKYKPPVILCADNMQFLKSDELIQKVEYYIEQMHSIGIALVLSASIDGKYCDFGRTPNSDEFYEKLKIFTNKYHCMPHPMISASNIKHWINNFHWWKEYFGIEIAYGMTMLEVRNEDWTVENIQDLITFCDYMVDETFKSLNNNKEEMFKYVFNIKTENDGTMKNDTYNPIRFINTGFTSNSDTFTCSSQKMLTIRAGDLMVAPCHRLHYPLLEFGKYQVEDGKITEFIPKNVSLLIGHKYLKRSCMPICEDCGLVGYCPGFCMGASYEEYGNMLVPQQEVCQMYRSKYAFLIYKYNSMGLLDDELLEKYFQNEDLAYIKDLKNSILQGVNEA